MEDDLFEALESLWEIMSKGKVHKSLTKKEREVWKGTWELIEEYKVENGLGVYCDGCDGYVDGEEVTEFGTCNDCQGKIERGG